MNSLFNGLPDTSEGHLTKDSIYAIEDIIKISNPSCILEIGLNAGHSTVLWLNYSKADILSVDICNNDCTEIAVKFLKNKYYKRFDFIKSDSRKVISELPQGIFDLIFIDGEHTEDALKNDINLAIELEIPYIVIDDYIIGTFMEHTPKSFNELELIKIYNENGINIALFKNLSGLHYE